MLLIYLFIYHPIYLPHHLSKAELRKAKGERESTGSEDTGKCCKIN